MKLIADFYFAEYDFTSKKIGSIIFDTETNTMSAAKEGGSGILRDMAEDGAFSCADQVRYYPKDGEKFMRALPDRSGSRSWVALREEK